MAESDTPLSKSGDQFLAHAQEAELTPERIKQWVIDGIRADSLTDEDIKDALDQGIVTQAEVDEAKAYEHTDAE